MDNEPLIKSLKEIIDTLDGLMVMSPDRKIADATNLLQEKVAELEKV